MADKQLAIPNNALRAVGGRSTVSLAPVSTDPSSIKSGRTNRDIYLLLEQQVTGGWLPRYQHGLDAFSSLVYCLVNVTQSKYGELKMRTCDIQADTSGAQDDPQARYVLAPSLRTSSSADFDVYMAD